jgi:hypothetical protein
MRGRSTAGPLGYGGVAVPVVHGSDFVTTSAMFDPVSELLGCDELLREAGFKRSPGERLIDIALRKRRAAGRLTEEEELDWLRRHPEDRPDGWVDPATVAHSPDLIPDPGDPERRGDDLDAFLEPLTTLDAYDRWSSKGPATGRGRELKIRCPNPEHDDAHPSASLNTETDVWCCYVCVNPTTGGMWGGDKYDIAAWHFGFDVPGYKNEGGAFLALRKEMAKDLGWAGVPTVVRPTPPAPGPAWAPIESNPVASAPSFKFESGGGWVLDAPEHVPAVWGEGDQVLWSEGEPCYIAGVSGVGKTTLAAQLVFARLGLIDDVLGYPVTNSQGRVLVLASDRPRQAQRAYRRLADPAHRPILDDRLLVFLGPPPADFSRQPTLLTQMCKAADADTVVLDSLTNMATGLSEDGVASGFNQSVQLAIAADIQVLGLHHLTKVGSGSGGAPQMEAVYGGIWITTGAGSVLTLQGRPGATDVTLHHVKQPVGPVGPLRLRHDHLTGKTSVVAAVDLSLLIEKNGGSAGLTAREVAEIELGRDPTESEIKNCKRRLNKLVRGSELVCDKGSSGGPGGTQPDRYRSTTSLP